MLPSFKLYNIHKKTLEKFIPIDPQNIRLYFCGPTVYDRIHLGNLRSMLCADILVRTLRELYPKVTFVRNITDVDDKIINRAHENNENINDLTERTTNIFHQDLEKLNILPVDQEPKATEHIDDMLRMIDKLIQNGHAYVSNHHVLFSIETFSQYGQLSGRDPNDLIAGKRVNIADYKRHPGDFVLWKPSKDNEPGWDSPYGYGRPGWHIECSAMSERYLGKNFDIHGGGRDLLFPHHENERAQSLCCFEGSFFAKYWIHVGMLQVNGEKMSKSLNNFFTVHEALEKAPAEALRHLFLGTHYRSTLDFSWEKLNESHKIMDRFYRAIDSYERSDAPPPQDIIDCLADDLNTSLALSKLYKLSDKALTGDQQAQHDLYHGGKFLGLFNMSSEDWFQGDKNNAEIKFIEEKIKERDNAKKEKNFQKADAIRDQLLKKNILLEDTKEGTKWRKGTSL